MIRIIDTNEWIIMDKKGIIHSGDSQEMEYAYDVMTNPDEHSAEDIELLKTEWEGDLILAMIKHKYR